MHNGLISSLPGAVTEISLLISSILVYAVVAFRLAARGFDYALAGRDWVLIRLDCHQKKIIHATAKTSRLMIGELTTDELSVRSIASWKHVHQMRDHRSSSKK